MEKFEFKSQICTDINQSRKLLELGLKKETADMAIPHPYFEKFITVPIEHCLNPEHCIPAWSLHRLMEIAEANDIAFLDISKMYNTCVKIIEGRIYAGLINKDYLEEKL